jgi:hypothetical protein
MGRGYIFLVGMYTYVHRLWLPCGMVAWNGFTDPHRYTPRKNNNQLMRFIMLLLRTSEVRFSMKS